MASSGPTSLRQQAGSYRFGVVEMLTGIHLAMGFCVVELLSGATRQDEAWSCLTILSLTSKRVSLSFFTASSLDLACSAFTTSASACEYLLISESSNGSLVRFYWISSFDIFRS